MTQSNLLEMAKQGDPQAIAALMNQSLQSKGMTAAVSREGESLEVILEAARIPNRQTLTAFVEKGISNLGIESIKSVRILGQQAGTGYPAWMQELTLGESGSSNLLDLPLETAPEPNGEAIASPDLPSNPVGIESIESNGEAIAPSDVPTSPPDADAQADVLPQTLDLDFLTEQPENQSEIRQQQLEEQLDNLWAEQSEVSSEDFLQELLLDQPELDLEQSSGPAAEQPHELTEDFSLDAWTDESEPTQIEPSSLSDELLDESLDLTESEDLLESLDLTEDLTEPEDLLESLGLTESEDLLGESLDLPESDDLALDLTESSPDLLQELLPEHPPESSIEEFQDLFTEQPQGLDFTEVPQDFFAEQSEPSTELLDEEFSGLTEPSDLASSEDFLLDLSEETSPELEALLLEQPDQPETSPDLEALLLEQPNQPETSSTDLTEQLQDEFQDLFAEQPQAPEAPLLDLFTEQPDPFAAELPTEEFPGEEFADLLGESSDTLPSADFSSEPVNPSLSPEDLVLDLPEDLVLDLPEESTDTFLEELGLEQSPSAEQSPSLFSEESENLTEASLQDPSPEDLVLDLPEDLALDLPEGSTDTFFEELGLEQLPSAERSPSLFSEESENLTEASSPDPWTTQPESQRTELPNEELPDFLGESPELMPLSQDFFSETPEEPLSAYQPQEEQIDGVGASPEQLSEDVLLEDLLMERSTELPEDALLEDLLLERSTELPEELSAEESDDPLLDLIQEEPDSFFQSQEFLASSEELPQDDFLTEPVEELEQLDLSSEDLFTQVEELPEDQIEAQADDPLADLLAIPSDQFSQSQNFEESELGDLPPFLDQPLTDADAQEDRFPESLEDPIADLFTPESAQLDQPEADLGEYQELLEEAPLPDTLAEQPLDLPTAQAWLTTSELPSDSLAESTEEPLPDLSELSLNPSQTEELWGDQLEELPQDFLGELPNDADFSEAPLEELFPEQSEDLLEELPSEPLAARSEEYPDLLEEQPQDLGIDQPSDFLLEEQFVPPPNFLEQQPEDDFFWVERSEEPLPATSESLWNQDEETTEAIDESYISSLSSDLPVEQPLDLPSQNFLTEPSETEWNNLGQSQNFPPEQPDREQQLSVEADSAEPSEAALPPTRPPEPPELCQEPSQDLLEEGLGEFREGYEPLPPELLEDEDFQPRFLELEELPPEPPEESIDASGLAVSGLAASGLVASGLATSHPSDIETSHPSDVEVSHPVSDVEPPSIESSNVRRPPFDLPKEHTTHEEYTPVSNPPQAELAQHQSRIPVKTFALVLIAVGSWIGVLLALSFVWSKEAAPPAPPPIFPSSSPAPLPASPSPASAVPSSSNSSAVAAAVPLANSLS